ncbi:hypothetical protein [Rhodococcus qingshengii]|uniref:hypothetical protein n=1 Tax=Rhodococcus qingshengii TaxID=334542 RepID=UPI00237C74CB|nr:hypothetical protein [Rhodococcus qingshengii]WCT06095.1 hypothetical protein PI247_31340 [Rhodococcus qingshengii]
MNTPTATYRGRSTGAVLLVVGAVSALLLSGCSNSTADPDTEDRLSLKMATDSEQITAVIESHLAALRAGSVDDAAASTCAEKQTPAAADVLPAITLGAVENITVRGTEASATVRGHTATDPYARADAAVSEAVTLTSAGGRWLIC